MPTICATARGYPRNIAGRLIATLLILACVRPAHAQLVTPGATLVEVYSASRYFEGPTWDLAGGKLYFTALSGGEQILRLEAPGSASVWMPVTSGINGTYLSLEGRLLCAQGTARKILSLRIGAAGPEDITTLAADNTWVAPNDLCQTYSGDIYFTTPDFASHSASRVYRIAPFGQVTTVVTDMTLPNGIIASIDGRTLYVADSAEKWWRSYPVAADGTVGAGTLFFNPSTPDTSDPDGMTIDELGNVYCTGRGGLWIVSPGGSLQQMVPVPRFCSNVTFGGADGRTLYLTCDQKVYSLSMQVRGARWLPDPNSPPAVDAGPDQELTTRNPSTVITSILTDDGLPNPPGALTIQWRQESGPAPAVIDDPASPETSVQFPSPGTYVLRLSAYDGSRFGSDDVAVTVHRAGDLDRDGDCDPVDVSFLQSCLSGANNDPRTGCARADVDEDDDVDLSDFGLLQRCLSGPGMPPDPHCAD